MRNQVRLGRSLFASILALGACGESTPDAVNHALQPALPAHATPAAAAVALGATPVAIDDATGMPRLLRGNRVAAAPAASALESARTHLTRLAPAWGVRGALPELVGLAEVPAAGGTRIVRIEQLIDGLPVDGRELRVMIGSGGTLVAASGVLVPGDSVRTAALFTEDDSGAVARAIAHTHGAAFAKQALATKWTKRDGSRVVGGTAGDVVVELAHAKRAWYPAGNVLVAAWVVEAYTSKATSTDSELYRTVLSADGRRVLEHRSLKSDVAFKYRVFAETTGDLRPLDGPIEDSTPHPAGTPNGFFPGYITPSLVEVEGLNTNPNGVADPWLPGTRTETQGNNVEAYADFNAPSGLSFGDFRATTNAQRTFDRTYDTGASPMTSQDQQMAGVTSLFYAINWLHDFWYDAGFVESAGNAQDNNYGRGGEDRDALLAEAQDNALGGSRNNANMMTPRDGLPPRMQVFLWSGTEDLALTVGNRTPATDSASFGPTSFNITANVVLGDDGMGANSNDGCEALPAGACTGKIVLVDRGNCSFERKALNIQNAGGTGMILANHMPGATPPGMGGDAAINTPITIGSLSVTMDEGAAIKAELLAGPVTATLQRTTGPELDGSVDATLIAHEFGHYLHHRLALCGNKMCGAISEGWGDFTALMLLAREGDNLDGAYPFSVYTTQSFTSDPAYYGIRRAPYSVNPAINSLSFRHMADGEPLPTNHPFLPFSTNSEVHNAGEVWASAMWEAYVALQKAGTSFDETRKKMAKYVVGGMLMSPVEATPTEVRDALLTVIGAASPADHDIVAAAFARRGFGSCAVSPTRDSEDFIGLVESTVVAGRAVVGAELTEAGTACDDDANLDPGETLKVTIPVANHGHKALANVTATLSTTTTGVTVISDPVVIPSIPAYGSANVVAELKLDGELEAPTAGEFTLTIAADDACEATTTAPFALRLNVDDVPETSATDAFDTAQSVWTVTASDAPVWTHRRESALDGFWHGDDAGALTDTSLVSPVLAVGDQPFTVTLSHRWEFEPAAPPNSPDPFDGGVIEFSTDSGTTWRDVSELAAPGYTGTLDPGNALGARMAFTDKNPSHPLPDTLTLDFGTALAGMQVQLRFRIGTDAAVGAPGWDIDDIAFTGLTNTPFPTQVADTGMCTAEPEPEPEDEGGGCCDARGLGAGNLGAALGVLALVLRRRRRRC